MLRVQSSTCSRYEARGTLKDTYLVDIKKNRKYFKIFQLSDSNSIALAFTLMIILHVSKDILHLKISLPSLSHKSSELLYSQAVLNVLQEVIYNIIIYTYVLFIYCLVVSIFFK